MFSKSSRTNVSEIGIGEGVVVPREDRAIASKARPLIEAFTKDLRAARVTGVTMGHRKDGQSISVHAKFFAEVGEEEVGFQVHLMKDGVWAPGSFPAILKLSKLQAVSAIVKEVAAVALKYSGLKPAHVDDAGKTPEDRVTEHLRSALRLDLGEAEGRLTGEARALLAAPSAEHEARKCWEDAVRRIVHKALEGMDSIPPELLHRLVDELYAKGIHDS